MSPVRLLGIAGSLRAAAFTKMILETLKDHLPEGVSLELFTLADLPLYNQDIDTNQPPAAVAALRAAIAAADGLVIATPEFNYGVPGVLKNALDWASRPYGASALIGKPVVTMSASPAFTGGVRALSQLHETLLGTNSRLLVRPQIVIGEVHKKVADGRLFDPQALAFVSAAVADLSHDIRASVSVQASLTQPA